MAPVPDAHHTSPAAPPAPDPRRLSRGALSSVDVAVSTMANIGPAMSFFFGFGTIVAAAGVAAPLTIVAAAVAIALLGNTLTHRTLGERIGSVIADAE